MIVCLCHRVSDRDIRRSVEAGIHNFELLQDETRVASACGCCMDCAREVFDQALDQASAAGICACAGACSGACMGACGAGCGQGCAAVAVVQRQAAVA